MAGKVLSEDVRKILKESFTQLKDEVRILVFTKKGTNDQYNEFTSSMIGEMAELDKRLKPEFYGIGSKESEKYKVQRSPTILVNPDKYGLRFTGAPAGEEGRSFITSVIMASSGHTVLSSQSKERIRGLKGPRHIRIFTSPT